MGTNCAPLLVNYFLLFVWGRLHAGAYQWKKEKFSQFFNFISCSIDDVI
jgi:hypothetical protein